MRKILSVFFLAVLLFSLFGCQKKLPVIKDPEMLNEYLESKNDDLNNAPSKNEQGPLAGMNIVCMGDSLFGMHRDETSTPYIISEVTGATVYNVGFGGTRVSEHPYEGFDAFSAFKLIDAITSGDWSLQDEQVTKGEEYFPDQLELLKSLDFSEMDMVILHFGTNDFNGKYVPFENPNDPMDTATVCGAFNYCITKLEENYPDLEIVISMPVYRTWIKDDGSIEYSETRTDSFGNTMLDLIDAIQNTADEHSVFTISSYDTIGINKSNVADYMMLDGTHFNEEGRQIFGEYIANCLIDEYA